MSKKKNRLFDMTTRKAPTYYSDYSSHNRYGIQKWLKSKGYCVNGNIIDKEVYSDHLIDFIKSNYPNFDFSRAKKGVESYENFIQNNKFNKFCKFTIDKYSEEQPTEPAEKKDPFSSVYNKDELTPSDVLTKGDVVINRIEVGDIHYYYELGCEIEYEVLTKPTRDDNGYWEWKAKTLSNGHTQTLGQSEDSVKCGFGLNLYTYKAYYGMKRI